MRPIQVCLSISKELHDNYRGQGLDDRIFCEAAEMLGLKLLKDGILEQYVEPDINRQEFHYILILNRKDLPEPKAELKPMNIPSAGGGMSTTPPSYKLDVKPERPAEGLDKARFLKVLDQWEAHAIRGMRNGATAYHQGKIALITDLRDWINREG